VGAEKINEPEGVQLHRGDGSIIDCELLHEGVDDEGMDQWLITGVEFHPEYGDTITIAVFPPRCGLEFQAPALKPDE
jgi:hypothetical protein